MKVNAVFGTAAAAKALADHRFGDGEVEIVFDDVKPIHKAFPAVVNDLRYDVAELAIVTYLQALDAGRPLSLLPLTLLGRFQHHCLVTLDPGLTDAASLSGKRVGVRSWSQTTGVWVRGIFVDEYGLDVESIDWVVYESGHVAGVPEPEYVSRAENSKLPTDFLEGRVDAAILGNELPDDPRVRTVLPNAARAASSWYGATGCVPINHMAAVTDDFAKSHPDLVAEMIGVIAAGMPSTPRISSSPDLYPAGFDAVGPSIDLVGRYAHEQNIISRVITAAEVREKLEGLTGLDLGHVGTP